MATVKSLIDFYNNQNNLAVDSAKTTASLKTQSDIAAGEQGIQAKRIATEDQLARFTQMMENLRQARDLSSREGLQKTRMLHEDMQAQLGRNFTGSENKQQRDLQSQIANMEQVGAQQRQLQSNETQIKTAQIGAQGRQDTEAETRAKNAQASLYEQQAKIAGSPDIQGSIQTLNELTKDDKIKKALGNKKYQELLGAVTQSIQAAGVDTTQMPNVLEAQQPAVKARAEELAKTIDSDFQAMKQNGARQYYQQAQAELQDLIASGRITDPRKALQRLADLKKRLGVID